MAEWGISLQILGVDVAPEVSGYKCKLSKKKAEKCAQMIEAALSTKVLQPGCAMKLAGRLSWATQFLFKRLGRAMLRPIFKQAYSRCAAMMLCFACALKLSFAYLVVRPCSRRWKLHSYGGWMC